MKYKYLTLGIKDINRESWDEIKNEAFVKPFGGLWASPYIENGKFKSKWHEFCINILPNREYNYGVLFNLKKNAKVYTIDTYEDFSNLLKDNKQSTELDKLFNSPRFSFLDFEKLSHKYDAIFLTDKGERETRNFRGPNLNGWDVESLLVLNFDCIDEQLYIEF